MSQHRRPTFAELLARRIARRASSGPQLVRNLWGKPLPCCWDDCWNPGDERYRIVVGHDAPARRAAGDTLTYLFCSPRHREYYAHAAGHAGAYGQLPPGSRTPLGLIVP